MERLGKDGFIIDTPQEIANYRLLVLHKRLKLEISGIKFKGPSTATIIKKEFGLKGKNASILTQYEAILREKGLLPNA